jgi:hypothetical protein
MAVDDASLMAGRGPDLFCEAKNMVIDFSKVTTPARTSA